MFEVRHAPFKHADLFLKPYKNWPVAFYFWQRVGAKSLASRTKVDTVRRCEYHNDIRCIYALIRGPKMRVFVVYKIPRPDSVYLIYTAFEQPEPYAAHIRVLAKDRKPSVKNIAPLIDRLYLKGTWAWTWEEALGHAEIFRKREIAVIEAKLASPGLGSRKQIKHRARLKQDKLDRLVALRFVNPETTDEGRKTDADYACKLRNDLAQGREVHLRDLLFLDRFEMGAREDVPDFMLL